MNRLNIKILKNFILNLSVYTEILPIIFYLVFRKRINDKKLQVVFFLLALTFMIDLYGLYAIWKQINNCLTYNVNLAIEAVCLYIFFYQIFKSRPLKKVILFTGVFYVLYWSYKFISVGGSSKILNTCETVLNISVFAFAIYYFYEHVIKINAISVFSQPTFWVVTAYLIYIAGTFFLLLYLPSLTKYDQEKYYVLNYVFIVIRTILLSIAMFMQAEDAEDPEKRLRGSSALSKRTIN